MASSTRLCRLCEAAVSANRAISLFNRRAVEQRLASRISHLLDVPVYASDGLPVHVCEKCKRRVETLERSAADLKQFKNLARDSYTALATRGPMKRTKESSGATGVSPDTLRVRPPPKRLSQRQLNFGQTSSLDQCQPVLTAEQPLPLQDCCGAMLQNTAVQCPNARASVSVSIASERHVPSELPECLHSLGRELAVGHMPSIAGAVIENKELADLVWQCFLKKIDQECSVLCQRHSPSSPFRSMNVDVFSTFQWKECIEDLSLRAPTLLQLLSTIVSHSDHRNEKKTESAHYPGICMTAAVLLKERNREMCGVQSLISLILYSSHAEKQVYSRLNHVNVSVSYTSTLGLVDSISKRHTLPLKQWIADNVMFKYCGDNVDKKKGVRDVRSDHQGEMLHMYSILAGRSRTPANHLSSSGCVANVLSIPAQDFLPSADDIQAVRSNLITLVSRVLTQYIDDLTPFAKVVPKHIMHTYSAEMAKKSEVVVVDVLMKNEAKSSDMIDIMSAMHKYLGEGYPGDRRILSGGDQLTCERQVGSQRHTMDGDTMRERLGVLEPVTEDWHCLVCLLGVVWKALYEKSARDHGTLGYFRSLLNCSTVTANHKKAVDANLEFLITVVRGHLLASACRALAISTLDSKVSLPQDIHKASQQAQLAYVDHLAARVVKECTLIDICGDVTETDDRVYNYAKVLCHYGALILEFRDACAEGDGERVYRCWRLLLPHFKASGRSKYSLEALRLQLQVKGFLSPQLAHQVLWHRFVNTKGGLGNNIQMDLYNEHVVKLVKKIIRCMGPNLTEKALQRAARSVSTLQAVCEQYDKESNVPVITTAHSTQSIAADIAKVTRAVLSNKLLTIIPGRTHSVFKKMQLNPLYNWEKEKTTDWINKKKKDFVKFRGAATEDGDCSDDECSDDDDDYSDDEFSDNDN